MLWMPANKDKHDISLSVHFIVGGAISTVSSNKMKCLNCKDEWV